jgi:hypothetical protein
MTQPAMVKTCKTYSIPDLTPEVFEAQLNVLFTITSESAPDLSLQAELIRVTVAPVPEWRRRWAEANPGTRAQGFSLLFRSVANQLPGPGLQTLSCPDFEAGGLYISPVTLLDGSVPRDAIVLEALFN